MTQEDKEKVAGANEASEAPKTSETEAAVETDEEAVTVDVETGEENSLEQQLADAQAQAQDWQNRFMRLHAEWDTYRRRTDEQRAEERVRAGENLVTSLLPVLDDFERSIGYAENNGEAGLLDGVKQVYTKLVDVLEKGGVEVLNPAGEAFNALEHQAVATTERTDVYDETVDQVYQKGYKMGRKVIRPAMVTVTSGGPTRPAPEEAEGAE
jgi:molecular chaperone GrpE